MWDLKTFTYPLWALYPTIKLGSWTVTPLTLGPRQWKQLGVTHTQTEIMTPLQLHSQMGEENVEEPLPQGSCWIYKTSGPFCHWSCCIGSSWQSWGGSGCHSLPGAPTKAKQKTDAMPLAGRRPLGNWAPTSWQIPCGWCAVAPRVHVLWGRWGLDVPPDIPCPP